MIIKKCKYLDKFKGEDMLTAMSFHIEGYPQNISSNVKNHNTLIICLL